MGGRFRHVIAAVLVVAATGACARDTDGPDQSVGVADTLPSGRILVRVTAVQSSPQWRLRERFRIGALEGDGPDVFGEVRDVELGLRDETFVLDGQAAEVRVFGSDGAYLRTLGRNGEGPGELNRPVGVTLDADGNVWVVNWGNARYTAFDPTTGELLQERRRLASFVAIPWPGAFDREGRLVDLGLSRAAGPAILRLDSAFIPSDTLPLPTPDPTYQIMVRRAETLVMSVLDPFAPQPAWSPAPEGIVVGEGRAYRLHWIHFNGDTTVTVEVAAPLVPVTTAEGDSALAALRELIESSGGTPERQPRVPDSKPAHGAILVDDQDRVWIRRVAPPGEPPAWDVMRLGGGLLGHVRLPGVINATLSSVRASRVAVSAELDGVPTVIVYDLVDVI